MLDENQNEMEPMEVFSVNDNKKYDIHLNNGHLKGTFQLRFRQSLFNWFIGIVVSGCGGHGVWMHYHMMDTEYKLEQATKLLSESQDREAQYAKMFQQIESTLAHQSTQIPIIEVDTRRSAKTKR